MIDCTTKILYNVTESCQKCMGIGLFHTNDKVTIPCEQCGGRGSVVRYQYVLQDGQEIWLPNMA